MSLFDIRPEPVLWSTPPSWWPADPHLLVVGFPGGIMAWIFMSLCLRAIIRKAGKSPGCLVWVPILQLIPAMEAAQMSLLWLIALFLPTVIGQILFFIVLGVGLARATRHDPFWGVMFLTPCTGAVALFYLAVA